MRKFNNILSVAVILAVMTAVSSAQLPNTDFFDFSGWSDAVIDGGGQTFTGLGVNGDIDVTVTINNDFVGGGATSFSAGSRFINLGHELAGSDSIRFDFSRPIAAVVKVGTLDSEENVSIFSTGNEIYIPTSGPAPSITSVGSGIQLNGNGLGSGGTATGEILAAGFAGTVSSVTVTHTALVDQKFERIMVGQFVPEPNSAALLSIGAFGLLLSGRKRRRNS